MKVKNSLWKCLNEYSSLVVRIFQTKPITQYSKENTLSLKSKDTYKSNLTCLEKNINKIWPNNFTMYNTPFFQSQWFLQHLQLFKITVPKTISLLCLLSIANEPSNWFLKTDYSDVLPVTISCPLIQLVCQKQGNSPSKEQICGQDVCTYLCISNLLFSGQLPTQAADHNSYLSSIVHQSVSSQLTKTIKNHEY